MPYYGASGLAGYAAELDPHVGISYDRVPKGEVEIRRSSRVTSSDGHDVGHVDGLLVDRDEQITHLVLEHGHLWGHREVTIPVGAVTKVETDAVTLSLSKDEVGALEPITVQRWSSWAEAGLAPRSEHPSLSGAAGPDRPGLIHPNSASSPRTRVSPWRSTSSVAIPSVCASSHGSWAGI